MIYPSVSGLMASFVMLRLEMIVVLIHRQFIGLWTFMMMVKCIRVESLNKNKVNQLGDAFQNDMEVG